MIEITKRKCKCGRPAERITTFHSLGGYRAKGEKFMDEAVCEFCYMLYSQGYQGMICPTCKNAFFVPLDILYSDEMPELVSCPYCAAKSNGYLMDYRPPKRKR